MAKLYVVIRNYAEMENVTHESLPQSFVIKPNRGAGGDGIIVISKKTKKGFKTISGKSISYEEMLFHFASILDGKYAITGARDQVIIEELLDTHESLSDFITAGGLPDIRIIVFNQVPILAMLRVPTEESQGKANLQLGAIGVGIDIATGRMNYGYKNGKFIKKFPNGTPISDTRIPHWDEFLYASAQIQQVTGIGYVGVDLVFTTTGMKVLEVNARPGVKIQICNKEPLRARLLQVEKRTVHNPQEGVQLAKRLFTKRAVDFQQEVEEKKVIGLFEPIALYGDHTQMIVAKIDPHADKCTISKNVSVDEGILDIRLQKTRLKIPFSYGDFSDKQYDAVISSKFLREFYIDVNQKNKIDTSMLKEISYKMIQNLDKKIAEIDTAIAYMSYIKPINIEESKEIFFQYKNFNPQFEYKNPPEGFLRDIKKDIGKLPVGIDHPLMGIYIKKIEELKLKVMLIEKRDTEEFGMISEKLFGEIDYSLYKSAMNVYQKSKNQQYDLGEMMNAEKIAAYVRNYLKEHKLDHWNVVIKSNMAVNMSITKNGSVYIKKTALLGKNRIRILMAHEIDTHVFRNENGRMQPLKIFQRGTAGYLQSEEGLAVYTQNKRAQALGIYQTPVIPTRGVIGAFMGKRMSFLELFLFVQDSLGFTEQEAFQHCVRIKRGLKDTGIHSSFTKDSIYFSGYKQVESFMKTASKEDILLFYSGKVALHDMPVLKNIALESPLYLPKELIAKFEANG